MPEPRPDPCFWQARRWTVLEIERYGKLQDGGGWIDRMAVPAEEVDRLMNIAAKAMDAQGMLRSPLSVATYFAGCIRAIEDTPEWIVDLVRRDYVAEGRRKGELAAIAHDPHERDRAVALLAEAWLEAQCP